MAMAPDWIIAGVFGMVRTTAAGCPIQAWMLASVTPAMMEMRSGPSGPMAGAMSRQTRRAICGLTQSTAVAAPRRASRPSAKVLTPKRSASASRLPGSGSLTFSVSGS